MQEGVQLSLWLLPHTECGLCITMAVRKFLSNVLLATAVKLEKDQTKEMLQADIRAARRKLADWIQPEPEVKRPPII